MPTGSTFRGRSTSEPSPSGKRSATPPEPPSHDPHIDHRLTSDPLEVDRWSWRSIQNVRTGTFEQAQEASTPMSELQPTVFDTHAHIISDDRVAYPPAEAEKDNPAAPFTIDNLITGMDSTGVSKAC